MQNISTVPIFGHIEGHTQASEAVKVTRYETLLPELCALEADERCQGVLFLLHTVGGDVEAGLALAEMIASMKTPTVSLLLGGGHSIGIPLAVAARTSFAVKSATLTLHPVRFHGLVLGVTQSFEYLHGMQSRVTRFVCEHSHIREEDYLALTLAAGNLADDTGTIIEGERAVELGLIDRLGGISEALSCLGGMRRDSAR